MKIEWSEPAVRAAQSLHAYIARDSVAYADAFILRLAEAVKRLESFPQSGRSVPEANDDHIREILVGAYRVIYRSGENSIQIVNLVHGSRDLGRLRPWEL